MKLFAVYIGKELNSVHFNYFSAKLLKYSLRNLKDVQVEIKVINKPQQFLGFLIDYLMPF